MTYKIIFLTLCLCLTTNSAQSQDMNNIDNSCESDQGLYPTFGLFKFLTENSFMIDTVNIIKDEEYMVLPSSPFFNLNLNAIVKMRQEEMDLKDVTSQFEGMTFKIFQYKHPRDCGSFSRLYNEYLNTKNAIFIVFSNIDTKKGFMAYKFKVD